MSGTEHAVTELHDAPTVISFGISGFCIGNGIDATCNTISPRDLDMLQHDITARQDAATYTAIDTIFTSVSLTAIKAMHVGLVVGTALMFLNSAFLMVLIGWRSVTYIPKHLSSSLVWACIIGGVSVILPFLVCLLQVLVLDLRLLALSDWVRVSRGEVYKYTIGTFIVAVVHTLSASVLSLTI